MSYLEECTRPKHRVAYPGELRLFLARAREGSSDVTHAYGYRLALDYFSDPEEVMEGTKHGDVELLTRNGEPVILRFDWGHSNADPVAAVRRSVDDMARFIGIELANEVVEYVIASLERWHAAGSQLDDVTAQLYRFSDVDDYVLMFLDLCEQIAQREEVNFDRAHRAKELVDFWCETDSDINVPGQLKYYQVNGPADGETQAAYDAEVEQFKLLIQRWHGWASISV